MTMSARSVAVASLFSSLFTLFTFGTVLAAGCSSSASSTGDGGVDDGRTLSSLSDAEAGAFCDQLAAIEGGYSAQKTLTCGDDAGLTVEVMLTFNIGANQAACKTKFKTQLPPACGSVTVGQMKACVSDTYNATCASSGSDPGSCGPIVACAT